MQIQVKLGEPLWRATGQRRLTLAWADDGPVTVLDLLARLTREYPAFGPAFAGQGLVRSYPYRVFVDGVLVHTGQPDPLSSEPAGAAKISGTSVPLADGQTVFILLPAAGG